MEKAKVRFTHQTNPVRKENYPQLIQRLVLNEAFSYTVNLFAGKGKLGYCVVCGKWFTSTVPHIRTCSKKCRNYLSHVLYRLRGMSLKYVSRRLRKTPLYLFLYIAIKEGVLPPRLVGEENPADIPTPLLSPTDFVEAFGLSSSKVGNELSEGVKEFLKEKGERRC